MDEHVIDAITGIRVITTFSPTGSMIRSGYVGYLSHESAREVANAVAKFAPPYLIDDEMVERAAAAMEDATIRFRGHDLGTIHRNDIARAALQAALNGDRIRIF